MHARLVSLVALLATAAPFASAKFVSIVEKDEAKTLTVRRSEGKAFQAPFTDAGQEGFSRAAISPDGRYVGWTGTFENCCTSYPLPLSLVVHDGQRVVYTRRREDGPSIFRWHFSRDSRFVIYESTWPHGLVPTFYARVRLSDGRVVGEYECDPPEWAESRPKRWAHPPAWTGDAEADCRP
ncbi:MAG: hypothetical protein U1F53_19600 [Burkholderiaceae bacterium]